MTRGVAAAGAMGRGAAAPALALALALAAAGCGGGTATTTGGHPGVPEPAATPTVASRAPAGRAAFIAAADAACTTYRRAVAPINQRLDAEIRGARDPRRMAVLLDRGAAAAERTVRRIGALDVPAGDEAAVAAYLDSGREAARSLRAAAAALRAGRGWRANRAMAEVRLAGSRGRTIASRYGFLVCGSVKPQAG